MELDVWVPRTPPPGHVVSESDAAGLTEMQLLQAVPEEGSEKPFGGYILLRMCVNQKLLDCLDATYDFKGFAESGGGLTNTRTFSCFGFRCFSHALSSPLGKELDDASASIPSQLTRLSFPLLSSLLFSSGMESSLGSNRIR